MSRFSKILVFALLTKFFGASSALACQIGWRSPAELEEEAQVVVIAKIVSARKVSSSDRSDEYRYEISVEKIQRGNEMRKDIHSITYEDFKAHLRGQTRVCPLKNGSGIEHDLKPHQRYILYLKSAASPILLLALVQSD